MAKNTEINITPYVGELLKVERTGDYQFILDKVIIGPIEWDYNKEMDEGRKALGSDRLAYTKTCKYGFVYKVIKADEDLGKKRGVYEDEDWDGCLGILSSYLYYAIKDSIDDKALINNYNERLSKFIDGFSFKSFKEIAVIVSAGDILKKAGLEPQKGLFGWW